MKVRNFIGKYENFSRTEFLRAKHSVEGPKYDKGSLNKFLSELGDWTQENIDKDEMLGYACLEFFDRCMKDPDLSKVGWDNDRSTIYVYCNDPRHPGKTMTLARCDFTVFTSASCSDPSRITIFDNSPESVQQYARDIFLGKYHSYFEQNIIEGYDGHTYTYYSIKGMYDI